jgi:chemotaxis protein CheD
MPSDGRVRKNVQLYAGQLVASEAPAMVTTILGSCVAVCLFDRRLEYGGVNHFLLPDRVGGDQFSPRFGSVACKRLLEQMLALGCDRCDLQAKVFGGASVLDAFRGGGQQLGARNVETALSMLAQEGIDVVATDVGGRFGRRLVYFSDTGTAWVKTIQGADHGG